mgnify:CR=1 FL=1
MKDSGGGPRAGRGVSPLERFSATVEDYRRYRPGYPDELVAWIQEAAALPTGSRVLDVGCGTGITTRLLTGRGFSVLGIDPNAAMLAAARVDVPEARYAVGRCEALPLDSHCVDLSLAGQAFHWFETEAALAELSRVARPGSWSVAFWNERRDEGLAAEYDRLLAAFSTEYVSIRRDDDTRDGYRVALEGRELRETRLPNQQTFDLEGFLGRARSASYFAHGVADKETLVGELTRAFHAAAPTGTAEFRYDTIALMWR